MPSLPLRTLQIITALQESGVETVLYGSQGISLYIGTFKQFGDIDLLVDSKWVEGRWQKLIKIMNGLGFTMQHEHEHEFVDSENTFVAFASTDILIRDGIASSFSSAIQELRVAGKNIKTLKPEAFLKAYEFSMQDGYRKDVRVKKDKEVMVLINDYLSHHSRPAS